MTERKPLLGVRLCLFCEHFSWSKEEMWGMGSTLTGPMMDGGQARCAKEHIGEEHGMGGYGETPSDDDDWRRIILTAVKCKDYAERDAAPGSAKEKNDG